ncbi:HNH endonuclease [Arenibacter algicola]|uniref:HNH endonuclease n=1 Tax=Arenibacter algicola TaxID=616991 RepID=UPI001C06E7A3|nr:HNH endonuclease signature motif containing protein [Arenibacter algicola]MBU2905109.1 HNH endonuclease [Arenibacter algicola]
MSISEKSRKTLWARSGNRCAICRIELVTEKDAHNVNLNLGEECHIISNKSKGPRHKPKYLDDYDAHSNLILLCRNHHRIIDEQNETYSEKLLHQIKTNHEKWVKLTIDKASKEESKASKMILKRITSGKEIVNIVNGMDVSEFDHDELKTQEEVDVIGSFLQNLRDWGDLFGMGVVETQQSIEIGFNLSKDLKEIEDLGFMIFGDSRKSKMTNDQKDDLGTWKIATIVIKRNDNTEIINLKEVADIIDKNKC